MDEQALLERLRGVSLDTAWSVLSKLGFPNQFCEGLGVYRPDRTMVGRARTVRCLPVRPDLREKLRAEGPWIAARAAEEARPGDVLVLDAGGETGAGFMGDVIAARFVHNGGVGIVADGAIRDLHIIRQMPLSLYLKGAHAAGQERRIMGVEINIPVRCGNVTVLPGDILLGDSQGVLVIPAQLLKEVVVEGEKTDHKENYLRSRLEAGESIYGIYPPSEATLAEYEAFRRKQSEPGS